MVDPNWEFVTAVPAAGYRLAYIPGELRERDAYPVLAFLLFKMNPDVGFSFSPDKLVPVTSEGPHWTDEPYVLIRADGTVEKHGDDFAIYPSIVEYNNKSRRASGKGHKHGPLLLRLRPACIGSLTPMAPANREGPNMTDAKHLPAGIHAAGIHSDGYSGYLHRRHAQRIMTEIALAEAEKSIPAIVRNELRRLRERNASLRLNPADRRHALRPHRDRRMTSRPTMAELEARVAELEAELAETRDWVPLEEAAVKTGQPVEKLRTLKRRGQIVAEKRGPRVYVRISSIPAQATKRLHPR